MSTHTVGTVILKKEPPLHSNYNYVDDDSDIDNIVYDCVEYNDSGGDDDGFNSGVDNEEEDQEVAVENCF